MKKIVTSISAILFFSATYAQIYLSENFDSGIPGTWTVSNNTCPGHGTGYWTWQATTNGFRGYGMAYTLDGTELVIIDSDIMGIYAWCDQTLTSPVFDPTASPTLKIDFDHYYRKYTGDVGTVEVYDGSSWVTVATYSSNIGGWMAPNQPTINLTPYINANMQIRFRYQANYDWYWAVDNVVVSGPAILPIELASFTGKNEGNANILEWTTASEINNDYFTIERSLERANPQSFENLEGLSKWQPIGTIAGAGNSNQTLHYQFIDNSPPLGGGASYYRLKQTDYDGKYKYSDVISVPIKIGMENSDTFKIFDLWPNPAASSFSFLLNSSEDTDVDIRIYDVLGQAVRKQTMYVNEGSTQIEMDVSGLSDGYYTIEVTATSGLYKAQKQLIVNNK